MSPSVEPRIAKAWNPARPHVLVVACSDGRIQEATDEFLHRDLGITQYDRLYVPGGGGALSASAGEFERAHRIRQECHFLITAHDVEVVILLFHGPASDGPPEAMCADYVRKLPSATTPQRRTQQEVDTQELLDSRSEWAGEAKVAVYRCEVGATGELSFVTIHTDPDVERATTNATRAR